MVHRCKECGDISKVTSGRRAEIENVKNDRPSDLHFHLRHQMLLLKCHCIFAMYGGLGKKAFFWILKRWFISWITSQNIQRLEISAILSSFLWGNLNYSMSEKLFLDIQSASWFKNLFWMASEVTGTLEHMAETKVLYTQNARLSTSCQNGCQ